MVISVARVELCNTAALGPTRVPCVGLCLSPVTVTVQAASKQCFFFGYCSFITTYSTSSFNFTFLSSSGTNINPSSLALNFLLFFEHT